MIIVKFQGGFGNQMFQYSLGRALSERIGEPVYYDRSWYRKIPSGQTPRTFELDIFSLPIVFAEESEIPLECRRGLLRRISAVKTLFGLPHWKIIADNGKGICQEFFGVLRGENAYLEGYWQSEGYFKDAVSVVRESFIFREAPNEENRVVLQQMAAEFAAGIFSVSVHIRRGDYTSDTVTNAFHGLLPLDYYRSAMSLIEGRFKKISYYVFSDDLPWCRENLKFNAKTTFVDFNAGKPSWMDMGLMSSCQHHIIANSSFSWWGAWLNPNKDKVVVAPRRWFVETGRMDKDILPQEWVRV